METDCLRPQIRDKWEVEIEQSIARTNSIVKDKGNTAYARFKWFKRDIFGLALVDTGNLVKSTLVSKEFWDLMGGKVTVKCDLRVGTAEKEGKGLKVIGKGEEFKFFLEGIDKAFTVHPVVIEGLSHNVNLGMNFLLENELTLDCSSGEAKLCQSKEKGTHFTRLVKQDRTPFPFLLNGKLTEENPSHYSSPLEQVWLGRNRRQVLSVLEEGKEGGEGLEDIHLYNAEKVEISPGQGKYIKVQTQYKMGGEMLAESIPYGERDLNCDIRIPESLYNFNSDVKQVFVENHSVNKVHLNVGRRIGTISYIEPAIDECRNASVGLGVELPHLPASKVEVKDNMGVFSATKYKSNFQTDLEKRNFIIQSFELDQNEILNKDAELKEAVIKLFLDNFEVLALYPNHYGKTDLLEMKIQLEPGAVPKRSGVRPLNPDQRADLKNQIDDWIHEGVIEPSNSPWASPLVPVKKKDGRTRWVTDLRGLNSQTVKDAYPLANIQENLQKLKGATVFSSLDAAGAYHAVVIEPDSRDCTAFISPFGTFRYIRMPFGLCNAGSVYSRMLDQALSHLPREFWASYLDDILAFSKGNWEHYGHLKLIVEAHLKAGIKIQPCKTKLFRTETEYLVPRE